MKIFTKIINKFFKKKKKFDNVIIKKSPLYHKIDQIITYKMIKCDLYKLYHILNNDKISYSKEFSTAFVPIDGGNFYNVDNVDLLLMYKKTNIELIKISLVSNLDQYYIYCYEDDYFLVTTLKGGTTYYICDGEDGLKQFLDDFIFKSEY